MIVCQNCGFKRCRCSGPSNLDSEGESIYSDSSDESIYSDSSDEDYVPSQSDDESEEEEVD